MKTFLLFLLITFITAPDTYVHICESKNAYAYHSNTNCSGFNRCKAHRSKVTKKEAITRSYTACKICY